MKDILICPQCQSSSVIWKKKARQYECIDCEERFDKSITNKIVAQTIFLSYAHKSLKAEDYDISEELVLLIKKELEKDGHKVWIDTEEIRGSDNWREQITSAILTHKHFISFLSPRSVRDPGVCLNEISIAIGSDRIMHTLLLDTEDKVQPPLTVTHVQWHDFQDWIYIYNESKIDGNSKKFEKWLWNKISALKDAITNVNKAIAEGEIKKTRSLLNPTTFESVIIKKSEGFVGREWLFDSYKEWVCNLNSRIFWIKGGPGIGKSAISAALIHQKLSNIIGIFFCNYQSKKLSEISAKEAVKTIAFQIASRLPDYRKKLLYQSTIDEERLGVMTADDMFSTLICEPLNKTSKIEEMERMVIIIDGLDEAGNNNGSNQLADLLIKHIPYLPEWIGVFITSRPEPYLEQKLTTAKVIEINTNAKDNTNDLEVYLNAKLSDSVKGDQRKKTISRIIKKSGGLFLYLKLVEHDHSMNWESPELLPNKLDGYFSETFRRYFNDDKQYSEKQEPFLRLVAGSPSALPEKMVTEILNLSKREFQLFIIEPIGSLLIRKNGTIELFHKSLLDWLLDGKKSGKYVVEDTGSKDIAKFLWNLFEGSGYNFFYDERFSNQLFQWLPEIIDTTILDISINELLDKYLSQLKHISESRTGIGIAGTFIAVRKNIYFLKALLKLALVNDNKWTPDKILLEYDREPREMQLHIFGILNLLCHLKNVWPSKLNEISIDKSNKCASNPYYSFLEEDLPQIYYSDNVKSALDAIEKGILAAHYDLRVTAINNLLRDYIAILKADYNTDTDMISKRVDFLSMKMEQQGDWDDWAEKVLTIKKMIN